MALIRHDFGPEGAAYVRAYLEENDFASTEITAADAGSSWLFA